jgi:hypothetical protein
LRSLALLQDRSEEFEQNAQKREEALLDRWDDLACDRDEFVEMGADELVEMEAEDPKVEIVQVKRCEEARHWMKERFVAK